MAEKLGYSLNSYAKIERGETHIKVEKLEEIEKVLGIDSHQLFDLFEREF